VFQIQSLHLLNLLPFLPTITLLLNYIECNWASRNIVGFTPIGVQ